MNSNAAPTGKPAWVNRLAPLAAIGLIAIVFLPLFTPLPNLSQDRLTLAWALLTGLLTGFHCVGMCGGFVLSWSTRPENGPMAYLSYGLGKTAAYTLGGALCGALGQALSFTPRLRGWVGLAAGVVLIVYGALPLLKRQQQANASPGEINTYNKATSCNGCGCGGKSNVPRHKHPFQLGLLNGLMVICGPLQAMYLAAAGTASPGLGAALLLCFGLGTLPVLLSFAAASGYLGRRLRFDLARFGALTMCLFGVLMLQRGLALAGVPLHWSDARAGAVSTPESEGEMQVIRMRVDGRGYHPERFEVQRGRPVRWEIQVHELNSCNARLVLQDREYVLAQGENRIEFQLDQVGNIGFSCWMGMLRGQIAAVEP